MLGKFSITIGQVEENTPPKGLIDDTVLSLSANTPLLYKLPENSLLFAFEIKGNVHLQIGSTETEIGNLGEINGKSGDILQIGLMNAQQVYLQSDTDMKVIPIIYKR